MFSRNLAIQGCNYYFYSRQHTIKISGKIPRLLTWHIFKINVDSLSPIMIACVLNQFKSHQLLFDASQSTLTMCLKFCEEIINPFTPITLINDDYGIAFGLSLFASNIKREVCGVLDSFLSFLIKFEERKAHNMLSLMLDTRFKNLRIVSYFCWLRCKYCG